MVLPQKPGGSKAVASATVGPAAGWRHRSLSSEAAKRRQRRLSGLWGGPEQADGRLEWWAAAWAAASLLTLLGHSALLVEMDLNARWVCIFTRSAWSVPSVVTPKTVASASAALAGPDQAPGAAELRRLAGMKKFGGCVCAATAGDGAALASAPSSTDRRPTSAECGMRPSSALRRGSCMGCHGSSSLVRRRDSAGCPLRFPVPKVRTFTPDSSVWRPPLHFHHPPQPENISEVHARLHSHPVCLT